MSLSALVLSWARGAGLAALQAGEVGRGSVVRVDLLGEVLELHQDPGGAVLQRLDLPDHAGEPPTARILARGVVTPRALRRALDRLGYG